MIHRFLLWCREQGGFNCLFQILLTVGLLAAIILVVMTVWDRQKIWLAHQAEITGSGQMLVLTNSLCEARLDRMQGIYRTILEREERQLQWCQSICEDRQIIPSMRLLPQQER
jgi:hypothetical protein